DVGQKELAHRVEHLGQERIAEAVINLVRFLACLDDVLVTEHGEVLRGVGLLDADLLANLPHRALAVLQKLDDGNTRRMGKGLENAGLETAHGLEHPDPQRRAHSNYRIYESKTLPGLGEVEE